MVHDETHTYTFYPFWITMTRMHFHIITLFPDAFTSYLGESIIKRAITRKKIHVSFYNPRDFTRDPRARVDRRPYGGGPGMVLEAECMLRAVAKAVGRKRKERVRIIFFEPNGTQFDTEYAEKAIRTYTHLVFICGRYEGIDARVAKICDADRITIGPYTLTGGELPAMVLLDCMTRRLPGVLGKDESVEELRVASRDVYTRPEVLRWKGKEYRVPSVLLSGNHKEIDAWKKGEHVDA